MRRLDKFCDMWQIQGVARNRLTPIRLALLRAGRSQRWLAEQLGISEQETSRIVNGFLPDDDAIDVACRVLGQSEDVLFPHLSAASDHIDNGSNEPRLDVAA